MKFTHTFKYIFALFIVVALPLLGISPLPVAAQSAAGCIPGLNADDCNLLEKATANMSKLVSFTLTHSITFSARNLAEGNISFTGQGTGGFDFCQVEGDTLGAVFDNMIGNIPITIRYNQFGEQFAGKLELRFVEGYLAVFESQDMNYEFNLAEIADVLKIGNARVKAEDLDFSRYMRQGGFDFVPKLLSATAQNGPAIDGQATRKITVTFNLVSYMKWLFSPQMLPLFKRTLQAQGLRYTDAQLREMGVGMQLLAQQSTFTMAWYIGKRDNIYRRMEITFKARFTGPLAEAINGRRGTSPVDINAQLQITLTRIGQPIKAVVRLENAVDLTDYLVDMLQEFGPRLNPAIS